MREREGAQQQTKPEDLPDQANIIYASGESRNEASPDPSNRVPP